EPLRLEVFGGLVGWSSFDDFAVVVSGVADKNPQLEEDAAALVEQSRLWARDNQDSFFAGFDAKGDLSERWMLGGRLLFDNAAVPDVAVGPNNYDSDALITSGLLAFRPIEAVAVGLSYSHHFFAERTITDSGFAMTLDPDSRAEDRWFYPHSNGTYNVTIDRVALSVSAAF
ncbi:MAG: long-subunit fatty acid transport protein, partial [Myxococcota bacterium]